MLERSDIPVNAIQRAVAIGLRVVVCDNSPSNPGHLFAHEHHRDRVPPARQGGRRLVSHPDDGVAAPTDIH